MTRIFPIVFALASFTGCFTSGGEAGDATPQPELSSDLPEHNCPSGTTRQAAQTEEGGLEQWCEVDGQMDGPYARWHPNGAQAIKGSYKENQPSNDWLWWHENAQVQRKGSYEKGKQVGSWTWWHPNGQTLQTGDYLHGRQTGNWVAWHENGQMAESGIYLHGEKDGVWTHWNEDGEEDKVESWQRGELLK